MRLLLLLAAALLTATASGQSRAAGPGRAKPAASKAAAPTPVAPATSAKPVAPESFAVTVAGSITDQEGLPLPGATVWNPATREILAVTNSQGEFALTLPTNAPVTLVCGYAGFADQAIRLRQPHRRNDFVISLEPVATLRH